MTQVQISKQGYLKIYKIQLKNGELVEAVAETDEGFNGHYLEEEIYEAELSSIRKTTCAVKFY